MICKVLDLKSSTVKVQLMRGREMMKEKLKEEGYND
jgi:DNA-directed RNA polymerase specialized sigma24 family protein